MGVSKFIYGDQVKFDITDTTATPETVLNGYTFHGANGEALVGNAKDYSGGDDYGNYTLSIFNTYNMAYAFSNLYTYSGGIYNLSNNLYIWDNVTNCFGIVGSWIYNSSITSFINHFIIGNNCNIYGLFYGYNYPIKSLKIGNNCNISGMATGMQFIGYANYANLQNIYIGDNTKDSSGAFRNFFNYTSGYFNNYIIIGNNSNLSQLFAYTGSNTSTYDYYPIKIIIKNNCNCALFFRNCYNNFIHKIRITSIGKGCNFDNFFTNANGNVNNVNYLPSVINSPIRTSNMFGQSPIFNRPISFSNDSNCSYTFFNCTIFNQRVSVGVNSNLGNMFKKCSNFNQPFTIPNNSFVVGLFDSCENFNSLITMPSFINNKFFSSLLRNCRSFNRPIVIPNEISTFDWAFANCISLNQTITIPEGLDDIACSNMFYGCINLSNVIIKRNIRIINNMFSNIPSTHRINIYHPNAEYLIEKLSIGNAFDYPLTDWTPIQNGYYSGNIYVYNNV